MSRPVVLLLTLLVLFSAGGGTCTRNLWPGYNNLATAPSVLHEGATLGQVMEVVHMNTSRVVSFQTSNASITVPGAPPLTTDIALERPRRFRLRANSLFGPEVDLGSNDEWFWFWMQRNPQAALYFCRHDQYATSAARQYIPVNPQWLIEAMGLVTFDTSAQHSGPVRVREGRLEIRSTLPPEEGGLTRITVVDAYRGWVLEQYVYSPQAELLASAKASGHRYDPTLAVSLPQTIEIRMPPIQLELKIDLGDYHINQLTGAPQQMWSRPTYPGFVEIDLGNSVPPIPATPASAARPTLRRLRGL